MTDLSRLDTDKIDEVALALLFFTMHDDGIVTRAWKGMDWDITDRLYQKGWLCDPKSKAKSVVVTEEGKRLAEQYVRKHFALPD
jgi:hypothetical protein